MCMNIQVNARGPHCGQMPNRLKAFQKTYIRLKEKNKKTEEVRGGTAENAKQF